MPPRAARLLRCRRFHVTSDASLKESPRRWRNSSPALMPPCSRRAD